MPLFWERCANTILSNNEKQFILKALEEEHRIDGRRPLDLRKLQLQISTDGTTATALLGQTLVVATITATIEQPAAERPNEGVLRVNVDYSPMAAPSLDASMRAADDLAEAHRLLEKSLRDIRAVDLEALCIAAGRKVWKIQLDVKVLDAVGNVTDAAFLAALAALMAFKRPEVSVEMSDDGAKASLTVHSTDEREAVPLSLHQAPLAMSFAFFQGHEAAVVDPTMKEEAAADGFLTVVLNAHNEICLLHKAGGLELPLSQILQLVRIAGVKKAELNEKLKAALDAHEAARVAARVRRRAPQQPRKKAAARNVTSMEAADVTGVGDLEQQLGVRLADLQKVAAELSASSDEEEGEMDTVRDDAMNGAEEPAAPETRKARSRHDRRAPVGQQGRAPMEGVTSRAPSAPAVVKQDEPSSGDPYAQLAARMAGTDSQTKLAAAVKRKKPKAQSRAAR